MTGNRILVGKFGDEVCKKGSLDVAIVSSPHPRGLAGPCHLATVRSSSVPLAAPLPQEAGGSLAAAGQALGGQAS